MLFVDRYKPTMTKDLIGNEKAISTVKVAVLNWIHNKRRKPILVYGPPGVGKTSVAYTIANELNLSVIEINASDMRNKKALNSLFSSAKNSMTLFGRKRLILIDDVDALSPVDRGAAGEILRLIKTSQFPIILTANDAYPKKISKIRLKSLIVQFRRISSSSIAKHLYHIMDSEDFKGLKDSKRKVDKNVINQISNNANGDVRAALNDFQALISYKRDTIEDIFTKVKIIFKAATYAEARKALKGNIDVDTLILWIDENIPKEYESLDDVQRAYHWLSLASLYRGRIQSRDYWGYLRYVFEFITTGVALSKKSVYRKFTKYSFPTYLLSMSRTITIRAMKKSIGRKISLIMHTNKKDSLMFLIVLKTLLEKSKDDVQSQELIKGVYDFTDSELDFINSLPPETLYI